VERGICVGYSEERGRLKESLELRKGVCECVNMCMCIMVNCLYESL
jgi:hypothetical protein